MVTESPLMLSVSALPGMSLKCWQKSKRICIVKQYGTRTVNSARNATLKKNLHHYNHDTGHSPQKPSLYKGSTSSRPLTIIKQLALFNQRLINKKSTNLTAALGERSGGPDKGQDRCGGTGDPLHPAPCSSSSCAAAGL